MVGSNDDLSWSRPPLPPEQRPPTVAPPPPPEPPAVASPRSRRTGLRVAGLLVVTSLISMLGGAALGHFTSTRQTAAPAGPQAPAAIGTAPPTTSGPAAPRPGAAAGDAGLYRGIVDIDVRSPATGVRGAGTGMILTSGGQVLTNNHVIDGATSIVVTRVDTGQRYQATVVGTDPTIDVALLQLTDASGLQPISVGSSAGLALGDTIVALGNAGGLGGTPSAVTGVVESLKETIQVSDPSRGGEQTLRDLIRTTAAVEPGDSGGPMLTDARQVVGMTTAASSGSRFDASSGEGFAIPIDTALAIVEEIRVGKETPTVHIGPRGLLGTVTTTPDSGAGSLVTSVTPNSPAAAAGIAVGDTVTAIDGTTAADPSALGTLVHAHRPGDRVTVAWTDATGRTQTRTVTLATGAPD